MQVAGHQLRDRRVVPLSGGDPSDLVVTGLIGPESGRLYVYQDGVELQAESHSLRLEDWDTRGPEDMVARLLEKLAELHARAR